MKRSFLIVLAILSTLSLGQIPSGPSGITKSKADSLYASASVVTKPSSFPGISSAPNINKLNAGLFATDFNSATWQNTSAHTYYANTVALGSGTGLSAANAATLGTCYTGAVDGDTIYILPGEYFRNNTANSNAYLAKSLNLIGYGPGVKLTGWNDPSALAWTLDTGSIYKVTRSLSQHVVDLNNLTSWGEYKWLNRVNAKAAMTAGTMYFDGAANILYVWMSDSRALTSGDTSLRVSIDTTTWAFSGAKTYYLQDLEFQGSGSFAGQASALLTLASGGAPTLTAVNVVARYGAWNGFGTSGNGAIRVNYINCVASSNCQDGFNYHGSSLQNWLEIKCQGNYNGQGYPLTANANWTQQPETQNGSTSHDGTIGVRVNCSYSNNYGPQVADVLGAQTWSLGLTVGSSTAVIRAWGINVQTSGSVCYFDSCTVASQPIAAIEVDTAGVINLRNMTYVGSPLNLLNGSSAAGYTPGSGVAAFY